MTNGGIQTPSADIQTENVENKILPAEVIAPICLFPFKEITFEYYFVMNRE